MPRNGAGTFGVLNPIQVGQLRSSSAVNGNFTDAGDELTNSLPLDGQAGMIGQFQAADGSLQEPGISFDLDRDTGFRRSASDEVKWVGGGSDRATMDANGKLTLAGALDVTGALIPTSGRFGPQVLAGTSAARATLRLSANDTSEHEIASYQAGSGAGAKGSLRLVGGGANDVVTMRFYVNDVLTFQWTNSLFTHEVDTRFGASGIRGDTDGFLDFPEITAPSGPAANVSRLYARDDSGTTKLFYKDGAGSEHTFQPSADRQIFTGSGTWTKPTDGQTTALIEMWGAGGSEGGGGGAYNRKHIVLASLSGNVSVTVGSGGVLGAGGNTSFGSYLSAFGGGRGGFQGGGGGGPLSVGGNSISTVSAGDGGFPLGLLAGFEWGDGGENANAGTCNPFGGAGGGANGNVGEVAFFGGAGGGGLDAGVGHGGISVFGGGGGGGPIGGNGGLSILGGGNGGGGSSAGTAPGGGGGGSGAGGNGARGEVRITCW